MLSILFPEFCVGCGYIGGYICGDCFKKIALIKNNVCVYCGRGGALGLTHIGCKRSKGIDGHNSFYKYTSFLRGAIIQAKYHRAHLLLSSLLKNAQPSFYETVWRWKKIFSPVVVPVPLHQKRLLERGFNQAEIIATHIAKKTNLPLKDVLTRKINTEHLANIKDNNKRKMIIKNAFCFVGETVPDAVLLVDDVVTTTSTIGECARELKRRGVKTVLSFSLAK